MSDKKEITDDDWADYETLSTTTERAQFLLKFKITAELNISGLDLTYSAFIGDARLPANGETKAEAIEKAELFLESKAAGNQTKPN